MDAIEETLSRLIAKAVDKTKKGAVSLGKASARNKKDQKEFDKAVPGDIKDMGRTEAMKEMASEEFGGEFPDVYVKKTEPMGNVSTVTGSPPARDSTQTETEDEMEFDELVPGDFKDMGRTADMEKVASEEFGGEFPDVYAKKPEPMGNVSTVTGSPPPVGEKARFDGADILDEVDIARRSEVPADKLAELFKKTHGGPFDPKSKMDKAKMATITSMIAENRDLLNLSPTQFALKVYARKK
jgi:hypothetical protein